VPTFQPYLIEHIWEQFRPLVPERETDHPLGCPPTLHLRQDVLREACASVTVRVRL
jgi:hypothetical protein